MSLRCFLNLKSGDQIFLSSSGNDYLTFDKWDIKRSRKDISYFYYSSKYYPERITVALYHSMIEKMIVRIRKLK